MLPSAPFLDCKCASEPDGTPAACAQCVKCRLVCDKLTGAVVLTAVAPTSIKSYDTHPARACCTRVHCLLRHDTFLRGFSGGSPPGFPSTQLAAVVTWQDWLRRALVEGAQELPSHYDRPCIRRRMPSAFRKMHLATQQRPAAQPVCPSHAGALIAWKRSRCAVPSLTCALALTTHSPPKKA